MLLRSYLRYMFSVVVPRLGVRPRGGGENLISPEEPASQETTGSAHQQPSQAAGLVLLYPLASCRQCGLAQHCTENIFDPVLSITWLLYLLYLLWR